MKIKRLLLITFCSLQLQSSFAQTFQSAVDYLSYIGEEYSVITKDEWDYTKAAAHSRSARKVENRRSDLITTIQSTKIKIARMPAFQGNKSLRDSLVAYLNVSQIILREDYAKIVDLEEIAEQSYDLMEAYILTKQEVSKKQQAASKMVDNEMNRFAGEFNITLQEGEKSKLGQKLEKAGEVYDYYNPVYLIFFKCFKQEGYLIDALNDNDMAAFEQNRNALLQYTEEGLEKVRGMPGFGTDLSLKRACQKMLMFYQSEAENKMPLYAEFYLKKSNMEKLSKAIESKPRSKLTKEEIDAYNKAINEYNSSLEGFNKLNQSLNKDRESELNDWNKTCQSFVDKHVP